MQSEALSIFQIGLALEQTPSHLFQDRFKAILEKPAFRSKFNIDKSVLTIHASDLGTKYPVILSSIEMVMLFPNTKVLDTYFENPKVFPSKKNILLRLHPFAAHGYPL